MRLRAQKCADELKDTLRVLTQRYPDDVEVKSAYHDVQDLAAEIDYFEYHNCEDHWYHNCEDHCIHDDSISQGDVDDAVAVALEQAVPTKVVTAIVDKWLRRYGYHQETEDTWTRDFRECLLILRDDIATMNDVNTPVYERLLTLTSTAIKDRP